MNDRAQLTVRRAMSYPDRLRAYKIKLDGEVVGAVRVKQSLTTPITPGRHSIEVQIDWCGSEPMDFEASPGERIVFECGGNMTGPRLLGALFFTMARPREYLWLRRAPILE